MSTEEIVKTPAKKKAAPKPKAVKAAADETTVKAVRVTKLRATKAAKAEPVEAAAAAPAELKPIPVPTHEEIARLAVQYWIERGYEHGQAEQDWFRAEQQLRGIAS